MKINKRKLSAKERRILKTHLKEGAQKRAKRDRYLAEEWFYLEDEASRGILGEFDRDGKFLSL